jgi:hypothetical protein
LHGRNKSRRKRLCVADTFPGKKKSPAISDRVECFLFGRFKQCREKPEEK